MNTPVENWNYRIILDKKNGKNIYGLYHVYYDNEENIIAYSNESVFPVAESIAELFSVIELFNDAKILPIINLKELKK